MTRAQSSGGSPRPLRRRACSTRTPSISRPPSMVLAMETASAASLGSTKNATFPPVRAISALISVSPFWLLASVVRTSSGRPTIFAYASAPDLVHHLVRAGERADGYCQGRRRRRRRFFLSRGGEDGRSEQAEGHEERNDAMFSSFSVPSCQRGGRPLAFPLQESRSVPWTQGIATDHLAKKFVKS